MRRMLEPLPRLAVGSMRNSRNRRNQSAILMLLARVNRAHHQARGFDGCRHSNLMTAPRVIELTSNRHHSVTTRERSREVSCKRCFGVAREGSFFVCGVVTAAAVEQGRCVPCHAARSLVRHEEQERGLTGAILARSSCARTTPRTLLSADHGGCPCARSDLG